MAGNDHRQHAGPKPDSDWLIEEAPHASVLGTLALQIWPRVIRSQTDALNHHPSADCSGGMILAKHILFVGYPKTSYWGHVGSLNPQIQCPEQEGALSTN